MHLLIKTILPALAILCIPPASGAQSSTNIKNKEFIMTTTTQTNVPTSVDINKETVRRIYEEALNKRNFNLLQDLISPEYTGIRGGKGAAAFQEPARAVIAGFPDVQWNLVELVGDGDKVVVKWKLHGTHLGQFQDYAATGKITTSEGIGIYELKDGKVIKTQIHTDRLGFLQDIGVLPADLSALSAKKSRAGYVYFIDKFFIPAAAKNEFMTRVAINRDFIKTLPGFVEDAAYEHPDEKGNLVFVTVATWQSEEALAKAKELVQAEYKKEGFNPPAMMERLHITLDRGIYKEPVAH